MINWRNAININIYSLLKTTCSLYIFKFFNSSERANRLEYLLLSVIFECLGYLLKWCCSLLIENWYSSLLVSIPLIYLPSINLIVRRLHDLNINGWPFFIIFNLVIIVFLFLIDTDFFFKNIALIIYSLLVIINAPLLFIKGTDCTNRYGEPPKI